MKKFNEFVRPLVVALALTSIFSFTSAAWTGPTVAPPGGNVDAPINTSTVGQTKQGNLVIMGLNSLGQALTNGLVVQNGNVGIGTPVPKQKLSIAGVAGATDFCMTDAGGNIIGSCVSNILQACLSILGGSPVSTTPIPTVSFSTSPVSITSGQSATLTWSSANATTVTINQSIGAVAVSGTRTVSPITSTTYTITATGAGGTATASVTVTVGSTVPIPTVSFSSSPTSITSGQSATLTWASTNATSISINQGIGAVAVSGTRTVSPITSTTYTITATGAGGTVTSSATITVANTPPPPPLPTITVPSSSISIVNGESATLVWSSTNATSISINQGIGAVTPVAGGTRTVTPTTSTTYTITATGAGGTAIGIISVTVNSIASTQQISPASVILSQPAFVTPVGPSFVVGNIAYIQGKYKNSSDQYSGGISIFDVSDKLSPRFLSVYPPASSNGYTISTINFTQAGEYLYTVSTDSIVRVINVSTPSQPVLMGQLNLSDMRAENGSRLNLTRGPFVDPNTLSASIKLVVQDGYLYLLLKSTTYQWPNGQSNDGSVLLIVRVANPSSPSLKSIVAAGIGNNDWNTGGGSAVSLNTLFVSGGYAYLGGTNDRAGAGNYITVDSRGLISGVLRVVDVSDPLNPLPVSTGTLDSQFKTRLTPGFSAATVSGNYLYLANSIGLEVMSISNPAVPTHVSFLKTNQAGVNASTNKVNLSVSNDTALLSNDEQKSLFVIDVSAPVMPSLIKKISNGDNGVSLYSPSSMSVSGQYAYIVSSSNDNFSRQPYSGMEILDIGQPTNPQHINTFYGFNSQSTLNNIRDIDYLSDKLYVVTKSGFETIGIGVPTNTTVVNSLGNVTGLPFDSARYYNGYIYVTNQNDPNSSIGIYSTEGSQPIFMNSFGSGKNLVISGNYLYSYVGGLKVFDLTNPINPVAKGGILTGPGSTGNSFAMLGNFGYMLSGGKLEVIDVTAPADIYYRSALVDGAGGAKLSGASSMSISGSNAYITAGDTLEVVGLQGAIAPVHKGKLTQSGRVYNSVFVSGTHAYVTGTVTGLGKNIMDIVDISVPTAPVLKGSIFYSSGGLGKLYVVGSYAYLTSDHAIEVINVSVDTAPVYAGRLIGASRPDLITLNKSDEGVFQYQYAAVGASEGVLSKLINWGKSLFGFSSGVVIDETLSSPTCATDNLGPASIKQVSGKMYYVRVVPASDANNSEFYCVSKTVKEETGNLAVCVSAQNCPWR